MLSTTHITSIAVLLAQLISISHAQNSSVNSSIVSIPYEYTYLLPSDYIGNANYTFVNSTRVPGNSSINSLLQSASQSPFVSYSDEFSSLLGSNPQLQLVASKPGLNFAYEAGVWVPQTNTVYFTANVQVNETYISTLSLSNNSLAVNISSGITNPVGGYYFEGLIYFATAETATYPGGIVSYDPQTGAVETLVNSYFGLRFDGTDDVTVLRKGNKRFLYFTDLKLNRILEGEYMPNLPPLQLTGAVWRFDLDEKVLVPVISRTDVSLPNGIRVTPDYQSLYVTDFGGLTLSEMYNQPWGAPAIYKYDIDVDGYPVNRRLFALCRLGSADGLHIDDAGRVWSAEYEGIVVRSPGGKVLGVFNSQVLLPSQEEGVGYPIANFALAGDTLVILASTKVWTVKLTEMLVSANSVIVN